ncbi:MAG: hypothetical protein WC310_05395 [Patescibacteria group bacterium]|jgi:predicted PurR-regulated permease PerM
MRKKIILIIFFMLLTIAPVNITKATNDIKDATTTNESKNVKFKNVYNYHFPHKTLYPNNPHLRQIKDKNILEILKSIIEYISKNVWGFIFLMWIVVSIKRAIHNNLVSRI